MAMHEIPVDGVKHLPARDCPCRPKAVKRGGQPQRTVYVHTAQPSPVPAGNRHEREGGGVQ